MPPWSPDLSRLQESWSSFVGGLTSLSVRPVEMDVDDALMARLTADDKRRLPTFGSDYRRKEWAEGRRCLLNVCDELIIKGAEPERVLTSLTHSQSWVISIGYAPDPGSYVAEPPIKIGVDMEISSRPIHASVAHRLIHPDEKDLNLALIQHWAIKEACYKAHPDSLGTIVPQYIIRSYAAISGQGEAIWPSSGRKFRFQVVDNQGWTIAFAFSI